MSINRFLSVVALVIAMLALSPQESSAQSEECSGCWHSLISYNPGSGYYGSVFSEEWDQCAGDKPWCSVCVQGSSPLACVSWRWDSGYMATEGDVELWFEQEGCEAFLCLIQSKTAEAVAVATRLVNSGEIGSLALLLRSSEDLHLNVGRRALQSLECNGGIAVHIPLTEEMAVALSEQLDRLELAFRGNALQATTDPTPSFEKRSWARPSLRSKEREALRRIA